MVSLPSAATAAVRAFSIPPQPLVSALKVFGEQSGQAILFRREQVLSARSRGVVGRLEPDAALSRLLDGTGFQHRRVGRGFVLVRAPQAASPEVEPAPPSPALRPRVAPHPQPDAATAVSPIIVTGTLMRGVRPAGTAMMGVSRETIRAVAATNVKELMASVPQLGNFGTNAEQSTPNRFRTQGYIANLHNLGAYATLTLLNGHRVAATGTEGTFPDPSTAPAIAIERTEIVTDGASPIYGSDAVAGVVNFIYRAPFDGLEVSSTYGFNGSRYEKRDLGVIGGRTWADGGVMVAYEYSANRSPLSTDVAALRRAGDQRAQGGRDLRSNACLTPTVRAVLPNGDGAGPSYGAAPGFTTDPVAQRCSLLAQTNLIPDGKRHAFLTTFSHRPTPRLKLWGELNFGRFESTARVARPSISVIVPRTNPFFTAANIPPALLGADQVYVARSAMGLFSPTVATPGRSSVLTVAGGLDLDLTDTWKGVLSFVSSSTRDYWQNTELDAGNIVFAVNDQNAATALNLFGQAADNKPDILARIDNGAAQRNYGQQRLHELRFSADGPLLRLPGGEARAGAGALVRFEDLSQLQTGGSLDPSASFSRIVRQDDIHRRVAAAFAELNIPVVGEGNRRRLIEEVSLSLSGRYDTYDAYGGRFNPRYGLAYSPIAGLKFRASYGSNFAAPVLGLLTKPFGQPLYNVSYNLTIGYGPYAGVLMNNVNAYIVSGGSPDLKPESAKTRSFGFDYAPPSGRLAGLRLGATVYRVRYSNLVYKIPLSDIIINSAFAGRGVFFPSQGEIAAAIAQAPPASPITTKNFDYITRATLNLGARVVTGLDIEADWRLDTDRLGLWRLGVNANRQLRFDQEITAGSGYASRLGTQDAVRWKVRYALAWQRGPMAITAFANTVGGYDNTTVTPSQRVGRFTTLDLTAAYDPPGLTKAVTLQVRIGNLLNQGPPFYDSAAGYNPGLASPFGRTIDLTARAAF